MIDEYQQLLTEQKAIRKDDPDDLCIHQLFEEQVERSPEAIAISYKQEHLSYRTLNIRANQFAQYMRRLGVGPGTLVGICIDRSLTMVISILAVLKAGGGYVPLDPAYPAERLAYMLEDAQVDLLLAQHPESLPRQKAPVICPDQLWEVVGLESISNLDGAASRRDIAYVIYTSGSTGLSKGVVIEHKGLTNMIMEQIRIFGVQPHHRVGHFASFSFDASVSEMFMTFLAGAQLFLIPQESRRPLPVLQQYLQENAITTITLPPSVLALLPGDELPALKTVISAGEPLSLEVAARWSRGHQLFNAYGPTEATVCTTIGRCYTDMPRPSIGYPLANTQVYILNSLLQPTENGEVGEMYIGGIGLARGYFNRPELTAEKFIPHLFSNEPEARLYKTGDLARLLPDGSIECVGRTDRMVKVRGFRVELGEIEATLEQHPLVLNGLVTVYEDKRRIKRLAAYVITQPEYVRENYVFLQREVGRFLQRKLPAYMLPTVLVALSSFSITANGKIDLKALPSPDFDHQKLEYDRAGAKKER